MIIAYEPFSTGLNHVPVNSEFLNIICARFFSKKVIFYGDSIHIKNIKKNINANNIDFNEINIIQSPQSKIKAVLNEMHNAKYVTDKHAEIDLFIVLNSHPHTMYFIKKYLDDNIPLIFIIHGNIEELKRKKHFYQLGYWVKTAFAYKRNRKYMKYIVLGDSIRDNLLKYVNYISEQTVAIPHPYSLSTNQSAKTLTKQKNDNIITMGMIGSFSSEKNSYQIFELEKRLRDKHVTNVNFLLVGSGDINNTLLSKSIQVSFIGDCTKKLSMEEYNAGIDKLDYILFFWPKDSYQLTASGALCDAIVHNKPIISIRNDYLTWVFNEVGDLGFLCDDINQIEHIVCAIARGDLKSEIDIISKNFDNARNFFSREHVAEIMEEKNVWMI